MQNTGSLRWLLAVLMLIVGFWGGTAWKNKEVDSVETAAESASANAAPVVPPIDLDKGYTPEELHTMQLFEGAAPSVVFITTTQIQRDFWTMRAMEVPSGTGSGFVWNKKGHIVTNYHVIKDANSAKVTLSDQSSWDAVVVGIAPEKDLAVLRIEAPSNTLSPIPVGESERLRVGQSVYAIGNPFGLDQTLTTGIISALGREIEGTDGTPIRDVIQTDAAINPGNSGGPLLDSGGKLIGVNTSIYSPSGAYAGIGFSIPVDVVSWVIPELIEHGRIMRPSLGIEMASGARLGIKGVVVINVLPNGAGEQAGLKPTYRDRRGNIILGDVIVGINNDPINARTDLTLVLEKYRPGDRVKVKIIRDDQPMEVDLVLEDGGR